VSRADNADDAESTHSFSSGGSFVISPEYSLSFTGFEGTIANDESDVR
jgi:hypothetical protein